MRAVFLVAAIGLGCSTSPPPQTAPRVEKTPAPQPPVAQPPAEHPPCKHPELWLTLYAPTDLAQPFCMACADACERSDAGVTMLWDVLGTHGLENYSCTEIEYAKLAVEVYSGRRVAEPRWRAYFEQQSWYTSPTGGEGDPLTQVASTNHGWLDDEHRRCLGHEPHVSAGDVRIVETWFAGKREGAPTLPEELFKDGRPADEAAFLEFLQTDGLFDYSPRTAVDYSDDGVGAAAVNENTRTVAVWTGNPGISCVGSGEVCEGFEWVEFTLDESGTIRALHIAAAG